MAGKRMRGEGYVTQLNSGRWRGQVMDGFTDEGKKKIISFSGETKSDVVRQIHDFTAKRDAGYILDKKLDFSTWANQWYENYKTQVSPSTYAGYRYTLKLLLNEFGHMPIIDILPMHINKFFGRMIKNGCSESKISKCRSMLIQILDSACANAIITRNAARYANQTKDKTGLLPEHESRKDAFTPKEIELLMENLPHNMTGNSIRLLLHTGLRVQELLALTKEDIAEDGSWICVDKAVKTVDGKSLLGGTKNAASKRIVPVPESYRQYAVYLREHGSRPFVWKSRKIGTPYGVSSFRRVYYKAIDSVPGVRKLAPHCCRHTYITSLQASGVSMENIARLAGHSKITTTDGYLHTSLETLENAVAVLNHKDD